jgi:hypothetical protein
MDARRPIRDRIPRYCIVYQDSGSSRFGQAADNRKLDVDSKRMMAFTTIDDLERDSM